jgi:hypothetical protein
MAGSHKAERAWINTGAVAWVGGVGGGVVGCDRRRWLHRGGAELAEFTGYLPVRSHSLRGSRPVGRGGYRVPRAPTSSERNWMRSKDPRPHAESSLWFSVSFQPACVVRCRSSHSDDHHHVPGMDGSASVARQVTFTLIDDTDGSPAAETVSFGLDGRQYVIDLSAAHAIQLRACWPPTWRPLVVVRAAPADARRHPGPPVIVSRPRRSGNGRGPTDSPSPTVAASRRQSCTRMRTATAFPRLSRSRRPRRRHQTVEEDREPSGSRAPFPC